MRSFLLLAFAALQMGLAPSFAGAQTGSSVKYNDKRAPLDQAQFPWLGKVMTPWGSWCSGTLVSPHVGISAGHCFTKIEGQSVAYIATAFQPIGTDKSITGRTIDGRRLGVESDSMKLEDWAVIVLDKPIKMKRYPKVAAFDPQVHKKFAIMGYPAEVPMPLLLKDCDFGQSLGFDGNSLIHHCKVSPGQSGGPLVVNLFSPQPTIVGMNSWGRKGFLMFGSTDDFAFGLSSYEADLIRKYIKQYR